MIRQPHILNDYFVYEFGGIHTVDTTVSIPTFTLTNDNGVSTTDDITSNGLIKLAGTGEKGATVSIYNGDTKLGETIVKEDGTWSFNATDPLAVGIHKIGVSQVDIAGNHSFEATKNIDVRMNIDAKQNIENFDIKYEQKNATVLDKQIVNINASGQVHSIELGTTPDKGVMQFTINVDSNTYTANQSQGTVVLGMVWQHASIKKWNGTTYVEDATLTQAFKTLLNPNYPANPTSTQTGKLHGEINFFASNIAAGKYRLDFDTDVIKLSDGGVTGPNTTGDVTNGILNYSTNLSKDQSDLTGNILTNDIKDQHTTINSVIGVGTTTITGDTYNVTGKYGILSINKLTGAYTYKLTDQSANAIGKVETFSYKITNNVSESTSNLNIQIGSSTLLVGTSKPTVMNVSDNVGAVTATVVSNGSNTDDSTPTFVIDRPRTESNAGIITWSKVNVKVDGAIVDTISINQNSGQVIWTPKDSLSIGKHNIEFNLIGTTPSGVTFASPQTNTFAVNVTGNAIVNAWNVTKPASGQKVNITSPDSTVDTNKIDYTGMQKNDSTTTDKNFSNSFKLAKFSSGTLDFTLFMDPDLYTENANYLANAIVQKKVNGIWINVTNQAYTLEGGYWGTSGTANVTLKFVNGENSEGEFRVKLETSNVGTKTSYDEYANFELRNMVLTVTPHELGEVPSDKGSVYGVDGNIMPNGKSSADYDLWIKTTTGYQKITSTGNTTFNLTDALFHVNKEGVFNFDPVNDIGNIGKTDGFEYKLVNKASSLETFHKQEIEIRADGIIMNFNDSGNGSLTGTSSSDVMVSRGANETITGGAGQDWLVYNVLKASDDTGGNGSDTWTDFNKAPLHSAGDIIDISSLLSGQGVTAENIGQYVTVESGTNTVIKIDRDGGGSTHSSTTLITLNNVNTNLEELLKNGQLHF